MSVHVREQTEVLLADRFAGGGELGGGAERCRLRLLTSGVRVDLGVHDEDVDVAPVREDVIQPAVADVVRPPVAADQPYALLHQVIGKRFEPARLRADNAGELAPKRLDALPLFRDAGLVRLIGVEHRGHQAVANLRRERLEQPASGRDVCVERHPEAEAELRVVLEERVRPRRAASVAIGRVGRRRQVAAVDRRAAGRVGDEQAIAEQLREQLEVRRLAAARAGAGILEERFEELRALVIDPRDLGAIHFRKIEEEVVVDAFRGRAAAPAGACRSLCASGWCGPWPGTR